MKHLPRLFFSAIRSIKKVPRPLLFAFLGLALVALLVPEGRALAQSTTDKVALFFIDTFMYPVVKFLADVFIVVVNILIAVAQYNDFLNAPAVEKGWVIIRDLSNMFFIVFLLIIAFGTIFKIESYRYNRILGKLVIFAFLINFSKFIAGFWIDIGQVVMLTFVNGFKDAAAGNLATGLGLDKTLELSSTPVAGLDVTSKAIYGAVVLALILLGIAVVVTLVMTVLLIFRIVMLWILIVASPLAFLTRIFPNTTRYSDQWWAEFNKNIILGPVMAFFLWLSLTVIATSNGNLATDFQSVSKQERTGLLGVPDEPGEGRGQSITAAITAIGQSDRLLSYMISIALLIATMQAAQQFSSMGGRWAGSIADKLKTGGLTAAGVLSGVAAARLALRGGAAGGKRVGGAAYRKVIEKSKVGDRVMLAGLTKQYWQGIAQRGAERKAIFERRMTARGRTRGDIMYEKWLPGGGGGLAIGSHIEMTERAIINEQAAEQQKSLGRNPSSEKVVQEMRSAGAQKGAMGLDGKTGGAITGARNGNWDDYNQMLFFKKDLHNLVSKYGSDPAAIPEAAKKEVLSKWGFSTDEAIDTWEDVVNETSKHMRVVMMKYLDLSRDYDPEYLAAVKAKQQGKNIHTLRRRADEGDRSARTEYDAIMASAQNEAKKKASTASVDDKQRLLALQWAGDEALLAGQHVEQRHGLFDEQDGYSYIGTLQTMADDSYGLLDKTESSKVMERLSPHAIAPRYFDFETGEIDKNTDPEKWSEIGKRMFTFFGAFTNREIGRMAARVGPQILGKEGTVGNKNAIFDSQGQFYEGDGTEEQKKLRRAESQRRWEAMYRQNSLSAQKLYMKVFYGNADREFKDETIKGWQKPAPTEAELAASRKAELSSNVPAEGIPPAQPNAIQTGANATTGNPATSRAPAPEAIAPITPEQKAPYNPEHAQASESYQRLANSLTTYHHDLPKSADELRTSIQEMGRNVSDAVNRLNDIQGNVSNPNLKKDIGDLVNKLQTHQTTAGAIEFNRTPADEQREFFKRSTELFNEVGKVIKNSVREKA